MAERFLDHHPPPLSVTFRGQTRGAKSRDDGTEEAIRDREIEQVVARGACRLVMLRKAQPNRRYIAGSLRSPWR